MLRRTASASAALLVALTTACQNETANPPGTGASAPGPSTATAARRVSAPTPTGGSPSPTRARTPPATMHTPPASAVTATAGATRPNLGGLTEAQVVGQLFMVYVYGSGAETATPAQRAANVSLYGVATPAAVLRRWHPGGVILVDHNNLDEQRPALSTGNVDGPSQISALTAGLQRVALADTGDPLLIATDQEGGRVQRITSGVSPRPAQKYLAQLSPPALTCSYYGLGRQLRALGVNQDFAPDADVVTTSSGVIGDRSFGSDPDLDATDVQAAVTGLQDAGVLATLKHWPGHGSTSADSHFGLAIIPESDVTWRRSGRVPFARSAPTAAGIMVGHLAFPALDATGQAATFSPTLVGDLLRNQLRYAGLIITDSLWMAPARAVGSSSQVALRALDAGNDLQLEPVSLPASVTALRNAIRGDPTRRSLIQAAAQRILAAKEKLNQGTVPHPGC